ncbi:hypothetical protein GQ44DRAFT_748315 [Phaeosphaeriaceae sp. PMI808]|nr:hypothetical protein GQ44DRAFT_748315 [Phaeosphaeriaceae sp. PMI808]
MASLQTFQSIPRFLLPRGPLPPRSQTRLLLGPTTTFRHASKPTKGLSAEFLRRRAAEQLKQKKTPVIPQPDKYRPPSHSARKPSKDLENKIYGPPLSAADKLRMATKKYPNMMSPKGTFSYWFFNNRALHMYITLGTLFCLAVVAWYMEFVNSTEYSDLLPTRKEFMHAPYESTRRWIEVYKMHVEQKTQLYTEQRLRKAEEVEKRKLYRLERQREAEARGEEYVEDPRYYIGEDGVRRRRVKRWFGIWE